MKRLVLIICILFISILLVGCGRKHQLTCIKKQDNTESKIIVYFNNKENRLVKMKMSISLEFGDEKIAREYKKSACKDDEYENCKVDITGSKVTVSYEKNKISKNGQSTLKDAKKALEKEKYSCTR